MLPGMNIFTVVHHISKKYKSQKAPALDGWT